MERKSRTRTGNEKAGEPEGESEMKEREGRSERCGGKEEEEEEEDEEDVLDGWESRGPTVHGIRGKRKLAMKLAIYF